MKKYQVKKIIKQFKSKVPVIDPDFTFYENIKKISLVNLPVETHSLTKIPLPKSLRYLDDYLIEGWNKNHGPLIELASQRKMIKLPYHAIFPGPYIPWLRGKMGIIGDTAYSIFIKTVSSVKQRVPDIKE